MTRLNQQFVEKITDSRISLISGFDSLSLSLLGDLGGGAYGVLCPNAPWTAIAADEPFFEDQARRSLPKIGSRMAIVEMHPKGSDDDASDL
jgi:hypothetical protein